MTLFQDASGSAARFRIVRRIGAGGMGEVFEAEDRQRGERVAIKTLPNLTAAAIYRLKQEFRALADVAHPNLISLFELVGDRENWFFTMELVDGVDFTTWVRTGDGCDVRRLRAALTQLASGVHALHVNGKVHRDLKPSNVLVERSGRVVVLDFGIATPISAADPQPSIETSIVGTLHYMAPEQAGTGRVGPAADWYAVGVILFEVLTGRLPFDGNGFAVLAAKQTTDPPRARDLANDVPPDLSDLCARLLSRDPAKRPTEQEVVGSLAAGPAESSPLPLSAPDALLIGRDAQLAELDRALDAATNGSAAIVYVHGESGMGKTALVQDFLARASHQRRAVVLSGRCYERESVPYKALDGVIDSLTRYLRTTSSERVAALLPRDVSAATRLFPVLLRVEAIADAPKPLLEAPDPTEMRRRGVAALRELLARVSDHAPLAVHVDDLQWADRDSVALLDELTRPPDAPSLLLVASFRTEEIERRRFLREVMDRGTQNGAREVRVGALSEPDARRLARRRLGPAADSKRLDAVVAEGGGNPLLIEQLAEHLRGAGAGTAHDIRLAEVIATRLDRCGTGARAFMETLAVAAHPLDAAIVHHAAGLDGGQRALIAELEHAHLLRRSGERGEVEVYHDRIREAVVEWLPAESVRSIHGRLVAALGDWGADDPEALFEHALGAGDVRAAERHARRAAERAEHALAFDRAARFYRHLLVLYTTPDATRASTFAALGQALANAGRPADAAAAFEDAAQLSGALAARQNESILVALEYRRRAAEQLLTGGRGERGVQAIRVLAEEAGLKMPRGQRRALVSFLWHRLLLKLRGSDWRERSASSIPPLELFRLDLCWTCAQGFTLIDYAIAAKFQALHLRLALGLGEPHRVAHALAMEAGFRAVGGGSSRQTTDQLAADARALAERLGTPFERGFMALADGSIYFLRGEWRRAVELLTRAEGVLREECIGVHWELTTTQTFLLSSLLYAGEFAEVERRIPPLLDAAAERGDLLLATELRTRINLQWLVRDEADEAQRLVAEALLQWSNIGFTRQHYNAIAALTQLELYRGDALAAWSHIDAHWPRIRRSTVARIQVIRCGARHVRARAALALAAAPQSVRRGAPTRDALLSVAERDAVQLEKEGMSWTGPLVPAIRGTIAAIRGDDSADRQLAAAAEGFDRVDMRAHASAMRWRLGLLVGGDRGAKLVREAAASLTEQGVKRADRFVAVLAPWVA